ncbi:MAG: TetR/AcrR family transcriptional regulator [Gemmatimonadetes bacterium]|nr:TetR/AcrR family transcriptional regulator [Gemmatimonadota bacterium]
MPQTNTPTRILDASEKLFSEEGLQGVSLRRITKEADVNLASIHYHFGSKENLFRRVLERRIEPLNAERLELLGTVESGGAQGVLSLEAVLEAFLAPAVRLRYNRSGTGALFSALMGQIFQNPDTEIRSLATKMFREVSLRFLSALGRALPGRSEEERRWGFHLMFGTAAFALSAPGSLIGDGNPLPDDPEEALARLVSFLAAGMRSHGPSQGEGA